MESIVRYILKQYFDDFIASHGDVDLSAKEGVTLKDLLLKNEYLRGDKENSSSGIELKRGTIGSLQFKAVSQKNIQVVASDIVFDFHVEPIKAIGNAIRSAQDAVVPGFVRSAQDSNSGQWQSILGVGACATAPSGERRPLYCGLHHKPERRARGPTRLTDCKACGQRLQTNYVKCALCPSCSRQLCRCVVCADSEVMQTEQDRREDEMAAQLATSEAVSAIGRRTFDDFMPRCSDGLGGVNDGMHRDVLGLFRCGGAEETGKVRRRSSHTSIAAAAQRRLDELRYAGEHPALQEAFGATDEEFQWSSVPALQIAPRSLTSDDLNDFLGEDPNKCLLKVDEIPKVSRMNVPGPQPTRGGDIHGQCPVGEASPIGQASRSCQTELSPQTESDNVADKFGIGERVLDELTCSACGQRVNTMVGAPVRRALPILQQEPSPPAPRKSAEQQVVSVAI